MAAYKKSLIVCCALLVSALGSYGSHVGSGFSRTVTHAQSPPRRIISLIPSTTEMLFAMGAGPRVVGVGNFDRYPPEALTRTKVGGLIDPDVERIISLKPDLVLIYGTQTDLRTQLDRAKIPTFLYQHAGLPDITTTIRELGARVDSAKDANALADRIEAEIADVRKRVAGRARPKTLLVFGRDAETLRGIYASGAVGFLHDMLVAAGGTNVFSDVPRQSIQTTSELAVARAPDVIVEVGIDTASTSGRNLRAWESLASIPAVRNKRIYQLRGDGMMNPGPRISASVRRVAEVLHPEAFTGK
ncbi:MAG TPA: helical backbone metal receptor [Vicinamibacterales bacterium]|nr:helical backbone metal receptor [Vicinamibacterales bacterium]